MASVFWSDEAQRIFDGLPRQVQVDILRKLELLQAHPEMYQEVESGPFAGARRIPVRPHFSLLYRIYSQERNCFVVTILDVRRRES